jgi:hypothetical protein
MESSIARHAPHSVVIGALLSLVAIIGFLLLELVLTMLVYTGLNIYSLEVFGWLVRFAESVLGLMRLLVDRLLPGAANTAYATLFGELGPKSILLLLIGLVVAAIVRSVVGLFRHRA